MFNVHYTWTISKVSIILIWLVLNIQSVKLKASLTIIPKTRSNPGRLFLQGEISFLRYWTHSVTHSRLTRLPAPCIFWYISLIKSSILKLKNIFIQLAINDSFGDHPVKQQTKPRGYLYVFHLWPTIRLVYHSNFFKLLWHGLSDDCHVCQCLFII